MPEIIPKLGVEATTSHKEPLPPYLKREHVSKSEGRGFCHIFAKHLRIPCQEALHFAHRYLMKGPGLHSFCDCPMRAKSWMVTPTQATKVRRSHHSASDGFLQTRCAQDSIKLVQP